MKWKKPLLIVGILLVIIAASAAIVMYPGYRFLFAEKNIPIDKNLTVCLGGGGNSGLLVTDSALVVIDTKMGNDAEELYKKAKELAGTKPIIVINTHYHPDHTSGNHFYTGSRIYMGSYDKSFLSMELTPENMPNHYVSDSLKLNLGNEILVMYNLGQAHTWDDMVVYLKSRKVLFSGDLVFHNINPFLITESGANVMKWMSALDVVLNRWDIKTLVPGHGEPGDKQIALSMKQYFADMTAAAEDPSKENELFAKYKDWGVTPGMTSPSKTVDYIKASYKNP